MRRLLEARERTGSACRVMTSCVLFDRNVELLGDYVEFCRGLGVDSVDFQVLARTFANPHRERDPFFQKHFWHAPDAKARAKAAIRATIARYDGRFLTKGPADLAWIESYVDDPDFHTATPVCGSHERNLVVDAEGNVGLCFNTPDILERPYVGNVMTHGLAELWTGPKASEDRAVMDRCTLNCGALNCHRQASS